LSNLTQLSSDSARWIRSMLRRPISSATDAALRASI
jgi:hypothetical protein